MLLWKTRFALSSSETNQKVGGPFDLTKFCWHVVKTLEHPDFSEEVNDLLAWWNRWVPLSDLSVILPLTSRILAGYFHPTTIHLTAPMRAVQVSWTAFPSSWLRRMPNAPHWGIRRIKLGECRTRRWRPESAGSLNVRILVFIMQYNLFLGIIMRYNGV
jgi:Family of unknown function (DUF6698)